MDRIETEEEERVRKMKEYLNCGFIRINLEKKDYDESNENTTKLY